MRLFVGTEKVDGLCIEMMESWLIPVLCCYFSIDIMRQTLHNKHTVQYVTKFLSNIKNISIKDAGGLGLALRVFLETPKSSFLLQF